MTQRALIVIDVQNEYVTGSLPVEYPELSLSLSNVALAMDHAQYAGIPIIVVQHSAPVGSAIFARDSEGWCLHDVVNSRNWQHLIEKRLPDAFVGTDLADWLQAHEIDTLSVVGYMTQNCVDATIRHACHIGIAVEFLSDAAGCVSLHNHAGVASAQDIHRAFCIALQARFAAVMTTAAWVELLNTKGIAIRDDLFSSSQRARAR